MSNTITIHVELGPESRALLNQLLEAVIKGGCHCHPDPGDVLVNNTVTHQPPQPEPPEIVDEGSEPPTYTREDIQALVQTLAGPKTAENPYGGKRAETRAIVKKYAEKVGNIPEDKFAEVMEQLLKLKEEQ